nr:hypothetical protein [uncultured Rhodopila sp.]
MSQPAPASPDTNLVNLILALLTPMFLWSTAGDIRLAHTAAAQTLSAYRVANHLSLWTAAKVIAFDIATLSSLSLSMYEDVSMSMALRLRGNANSLDRSGERNRHALEQANRTVEAGETEDSVAAAIAEAQRMVNEAKARIRAAAEAAEAQPDPAPIAEPAAEATPAPASEPRSAAVPSAAQQRRSAWADAMTVVAGELTADLKDLPPAERWKEMARIEALTIAAADLASGAAPPPFPGMAMAAE